VKTKEKYIIFGAALGAACSVCSAIYITKWFMYSQYKDAEAFIMMLLLEAAIESQVKRDERSINK